jgi:L-ascorbate metabolism protein UlaG (beta-lactamase superfamily)
MFLLYIFLAATTISALSIVIYLRFNPQFGGRFTADHKKVYAQSPRWDGKIFVNQSKTSVDVNLRTMPSLLKASFTGRKERNPKEKLAVVPFEKTIWEAGTEDFKFAWYGHSACIMKLAGKNILIDPMLGPDASPVGPFRTYRFSSNTLEIISTFPEIDAVLLTHDHYDHLDYESIKRLKTKVKHYYTALGVKRHLLRWNIPSDQITELDWWDTVEVGDVQIIFTPSRHFSGRGATDRAKCLWGGWVFLTPQSRIYWSGDGGYDTHFKEVGNKFGPFDWAFLECGQYYKLWTQIHLSPEEAVQAGIDVKAKYNVPVHWGAFTLAMHDWVDPVRRFVAKAEEEKQSVVIPKLGAIVSSPKDFGSWWLE